MKEYTSLPVKIVKHFLLLFGSVIMILPFIWMLSTSFKPNAEILTWPPQFVPRHWTMAHYIRVFEVAPFVKFFFNSLTMTLICTATVIVTSTVAGYVFSKFNFPGKTFLFMITLATSMVPLEVYMVPLYLNIVKLRMINTFFGLCAPYLIMSYGIFFMRQNVTATIPDELLDAARIDGAGEYRIFGQVVLPLLSGSCGALAILAFQAAWGAFIWPLMVTSNQSMFTMELGLCMFQYKFSVDYGPLNAGSVLSITPVIIFFLLLRQKIMGNISISGMKA